jgi:hypothetical protein
MSDIWQVGIDTLPEYRQRGLAVYLVKTLTDEIVKNGSVKQRIQTCMGYIFTIKHLRRMEYMRL